MNTIYKKYVIDPIPDYYVGHDDNDPPIKQYNLIRNHLMELEVLEDGETLEVKEEFVGEYRTFIATMHYMATGEGSTLWVIAKQASSMGEFIASLDEKIGNYYIQGMRFYDNVLPDEDDIAFEALCTPHIHSLLRDKEGSIDVELMSHVNYS